MQPFFTARPTSESYNNPLIALPEGSMVEYTFQLGPRKPPTIIGKKISSPKILNTIPALCAAHCVKGISDTPGNTREGVIWHN